MGIMDAIKEKDPIQVGKEMADYTGKPFTEDDQKIVGHEEQVTREITKQQKRGGENKG